MCWVGRPITTLAFENWTSFYTVLTRVPTPYNNITPRFTALLQPVAMFLYVSGHFFTHLCQYLLNVGCLDEFLRVNRLSAASKGLYAAVKINGCKWRHPGIISEHELIIKTCVRSKDS